MKWTFLLWGFMVLQRISEMLFAHRNARWMRQSGGREFGKEHYPLIVATHALFFIGILLESFFLHAEPPSWWFGPFLVFLLAQILRYWCIVSLGKCWNTRIWVLPGYSICTSGPYKYMKHPNYLAVMLELFTFPLIFGAFLTSIIVTFVNAFVLLLLRIPTEEIALAKITTYQEEMENKTGFIPTWTKNN